MGVHNVSWKATRQIGCPHFCVEVQGNAELDAHVLYCGRSGVLAGCPHDEIGHPRGFVGTQIFAWTVTCCCWVSTNMRWVATCRLCTPRFMGGKPRDYCAHPLRLRVDPQKIGNFHALEVHTRPPSSTHSHNSPRESAAWCHVCHVQAHVFCVRAHLCPACCVEARIFARVRPPA